MLMPGGGSNRKRGQVLLMVTLVMVPLMGTMGLVTDIGYMYFIKMSAQTAAQAASQAAMIDYKATVGSSIVDCTVVPCSSTPTICPTITTPANSIEVGCLYAQAHGFTGPNKQVTYESGVSSTPPTAPGSGSASFWVTYRVVQRVPQLFSAVLGNTSGLIAARSTAGVQGASDCVYALNPTISGAISVGGTASLTSSCGLFVNSNHESALGSNGGGILSAPNYDVVGGVETHYALTPPANTGVSPAADPLSGLAAPASAPYLCDYNNYNAPNWENVTLSPGVYCNGIDVKNNTYTFSPGVYIIVGGGLSTQSANSHIVGDGVMFYITHGETNLGTYPYKGVDIAATSTVSLKASNTGSYAGILFFEDRSAPETNDTYGGGSSAVYQGTIYAKNADITIYGNSSVDSKYTIVVADTINLVGTTGFNNDYSLLQNGSPVQKVVVVE
jgi:hypothetical protein